MKLWTQQDVADHTESRALHFRQKVMSITDAIGDTKREQRAAMRLCRWCFYFGRGLAGQAFTAYTCRGCAEERQHPNTSVPLLCDGCADRLTACRKCGGAREWSLALEIEPAAQLPALREIAGAARAWLNASTAKVAKYRRVALEKSVERWELAFPTKEILP